MVASGVTQHQKQAIASWKPAMDNQAPTKLQSRGRAEKPGDPPSRKKDRVRRWLLRAHISHLLALTPEATAEQGLWHIAQH